MKLRYFGYYLRNEIMQNKFLYNIKPIIDAYTKSSNCALKSSFKIGNEHVYLTKISGHQNLYYLIQTNDRDLIRKVNSLTFTVQNIREILNTDEKIGFTSYVYIDPKLNIIALANSIASPKYDVLNDFINNLFSKIGLKNYKIEMSALSQNKNKKELMKMEIVNSMFIDIAADRGIGSLISNALFGSHASGIGNFKITIQSTRGNIKDSFDYFAKNNIDENNMLDKKLGATSFGVRAKEDSLRGHLLDYWLDNEECIFDTINPKAKRKNVAQQIEGKFDSNKDKDNLLDKFTTSLSLIAKNDAILDKYKDHRTIDAIILN